MTEILNNIVKESGISKIITSYKEQFEEYEEELIDDSFLDTYGVKKEINDDKVTITMAGGGAHWWNYEIIFLDDGDYEVYVISENEHMLVDDIRIFLKYGEEYGLYICGDPSWDYIDEEKFEYFEESDDYYEVNYYHYFE